MWYWGFYTTTGILQVLQKNCILSIHAIKVTRRENFVEVVIEIYVPPNETKLGEFNLQKKVYCEKIDAKALHFLQGI